MREFIVVLQHKNAPELQVTISGIRAANELAARMAAQQYMFAPVWVPIDSSEVP